MAEHPMTMSDTDNRKIALFDMDGTLADYIGTMVRDLNRLRSPVEPELTVHDLKEPVPDWLENRMTVIKNVPGWWKALPTLDDGFLVLDWAVRMGFHPQVCTKGPRKTTIAWEEKYLWCQKNIDGAGFTKEPIDITITHDKSGIYGTVLVEDWPPYVKGWLKWRKRGTVILLDRPYNQDFDHPQVVRFIDNNSASTEAMLKALRAAYDR